MSADTPRPETPRNSLVERTADRFGIAANGLLPTLKATAFKSGTPVSNEQMAALLIVAEQYGLNPFTRELFAFPDKGGIVPVVSVDGWARIINEKRELDGIDFEVTGEGAALAVTCSIWRKDRTHPIRVTEYLAECKRDTPPWRSHPRRMLRHKALIQCARMAFGFAGIHDEDEAQRIVNMGPVERVEPVSTAAARVREFVPANRGDAPAETVDARQVETHFEQFEPEESDTQALFDNALKLVQTAPREVVEATLEQAPDVLTPEQCKALEAAYATRFPNTEE
jgi:phage recombination protein Bet